jgi:hypothetical protein
VNRPLPGDTPAGIDVVTTDGVLISSLGIDQHWFLASNHAWSPDGTRLVALQLQANGERVSEDGARTISRAIVVDVATGTASEGFRSGRYVWRSPDTLATYRTGGVFETDLAGRTLRRLYPFGRTGEPVELVIRAAS